MLSAVIDIGEAGRILKDSEHCHAEFGVWPISFSYPKASLASSSESRSRLVAQIVPGTSYSYTNEETYLGEYGSSYFGLTHKKGGWDCFRHLEILYSGAIPLMHDSIKIPKFSMIHYPKNAMAQTFVNFKKNPREPDQATRLSFKDHFNRHLTSEAMARYVLATSRIKRGSRVLFVDENLERSVDYLSLFTLIGLYQLSDVSVTSMFPTPYLWTDWRGDNANLYGRGFGYSRLLSPNLRQNHFPLSVRKIRQALQSDQYDAVVFGSIMRNLGVHAHLRPYLDPSRTIFINGEDLPVGPETLKGLTSTGSHVFVRSIG